ISAALNTLFARVQNGRHMEESTQRLLHDITNLTMLLRLARNGQPVSLPVMSNGPLDPLVRELQMLPSFAIKSANPFTRPPQWRP
ncbi:MAG: hypothetical protein ACRDHZ_16635, partial [Ktedonobacteraceae bacterium]